MHDGGALLVTGVHEVVRALMHGGLDEHRTDDGDVVRLLGRLGHVAAQLEVGRGADRIGEALGLAFLRIEGVDVAHAALHVEVDDGLGLAAFAGRARGGGGAQLVAVGQDADTKGGLGGLEHELTPGFAVEGEHWIGHDGGAGKGWLGSEEE